MPALSKHKLFSGIIFLALTMADQMVFASVVYLEGQHLSCKVSIAYVFLIQYRSNNFRHWQKPLLVARQDYAIFKSI
jgi:hypothetical protein